MPEREIDEDDTETAALQSTLRRYSSKTRLTQSEDGDNHEDRSEADHNPDTDNKEVRGRDRRRGGSNPEREIVEDDTETAAFQSSLRRLAASKTVSASSPQLASQASNSDGENSAEVSLITSRMTAHAQRPGARNKTIFRPSAMRSGRGRPGPRGGLQRSRTWEGFSSGLRYESVSDAGMPPPPPAPPTKAKR